MKVQSLIKREGPTETRTRIAGFRVLSANHYTIRPRLRMTIFKIYFMHYFWFRIKWSNWVIVNLEDLLRNIIKLETWLFTWKQRYNLGNITIHLIRSIWTWKHRVIQWSFQANIDISKFICISYLIIRFPGYISKSNMELGNLKVYLETSIST